MKRSQIRGTTRVFCQGRFIALLTVLGSLTFLFSGALWAATTAGMTNATISLNDRPPDDIGPNHRSWTTGGVVPTVELTTGMNFWDGQQWSPSDPSFTIEGDAFVANRVQHKSRISANLNTGER